MDGAFGGGYVERHAPAEEVARVQITKNQVGVRHSRVGAASAVTDWPRLRARGIRADFEQPEAVDAGDAATTRPDFDQVYAADLDR